MSHRSAKECSAYGSLFNHHLTELTSHLDPAECERPEEELLNLNEWSINQGLYSGSPHMGSQLAFCSPGSGPHRYETVLPAAQQSSCHCHPAYFLVPQHEELHLQGEQLDEEIDGWDRNPVSLLNQPFWDLLLILSQRKPAPVPAPHQPQTLSGALSEGVSAVQPDTQPVSEHW